MRVLTYTQVLSVANKGWIKLDNIIFTCPDALRTYAQENPPTGGEMEVGGIYLYAAKVVDGQGTIVSFAPGSPPDPGFVP